MSEFLDTTFYSFDTIVFSFFGNIQNTAFNYISDFVSLFGTTEAFIVYCIIAILLCCFKKTRRYGIPLVIGLTIGSLITNIWLKPTIARPRPYVGLVDTPFWDIYEQFHIFAGSRLSGVNSFPSGHTTLAFEVAVPIGMVAWKEKKRWLSIILIVFATLIALSRIYLMVHYPTDVIVGFVIGVLAGVIGFYIGEFINSKKEL